MTSKVFVMQCPGVFSESYCQSLIADFENAHNKVRRDSVHHIHSHGESRKTFTEMLMPDAYYNANKNLIKYVYNVYRDQLYKLVCLPDEYAIEAARMKRYDVGQGFGWHTDVGDEVSAKRMLVCMTYLNDNFEGGETEFEMIDGNLTIKPETGKLVVFPATFTFPHRGNVLQLGSKYIINQYIHYV